MASTFDIELKGLDVIDTVKNLSKDIPLIAVQTVNKTADRTRTFSARKIREQVSFPASYLNPSAKKLYVAKKATKTNISATIKASGRPTSLARFTTGGRFNKRGITVQVSPGRTKQMGNAFLMRLKSGSASIDTRSNLGVAIRLRNGEVLRNKKSFRRINKNLYLLYGPSVDQVFMGKDRTGVILDAEPFALDYAEKEFLRLLKV
jgi:hypothetical protein